MVSEAPRSSARAAFWSNEALWPYDTPTHIFLARVVQRVGTILFGAAWTGHEPQAEPLDPLPELFDTQVDPSQMRRACRLLWEFDENYKGRCPEYAPLLERWPYPNEQEWIVARQISEHQNEIDRQSLERFYEVAWRLASLFKDGSILTATRDFDGGPERHQDRFFWNTENFWPRFCTCQINPQAPYGREVISVGGAYIFVERASLTRVLTPPQPEIAAEPEATIGSGYLSPYLRCMIRTSLALEITPDNQPKVAVLEVEFPKYWELPVKLSRRDLKSMATLVRDPESKVGRRPQPKRGQG